MNLLEYIDWLDSGSAERMESEALSALAEARRILPMASAVHVVWKNYRTTAGRAYFHNNTICLSRPLLTTPARVRDTVMHEYAHLWVNERYGQRALPHGKQWKSAMRRLRAKPEVTHDYECERNRTQHRHAYACEKCGGLIYRVRPLMRGRRYLHVGCGGRLSHVDQMDRRRVPLSGS
jgi:predicted SprT family Zn-dependent metalloprotease